MKEQIQKGQIIVCEQNFRSQQCKVIIFCFLLFKSREKLKKQNELNDPEVEELKSIIKSYQQEISEIKKKYEEFKVKESSKYNDDQQKLIETIEIYQEDALNWKEKYEVLAENSQKQNKFIEQLQNELDKNKQQKLKSKPLKNDQEELITQYEQKFQEDQEQINELQENLQEYETQFNQLAEDNQNLQTELQEKDDLIKEGSKAYEDKINQLQQEIEELQQRDEQDQQDQELMEQNQILNEKLNEIGQENQMLSEENQQLQQINMQLKTQITELKIKLDKPQPSKEIVQTSHTSPQSKSKLAHDESDDYLVRQLRKFQELQAQKGSESIQTKKGGKMQKGASTGKGSFGGKKQTKR